MQIFDMPKYGATDENGNRTKKVWVEGGRGRGRGRGGKTTKRMRAKLYCHEYKKILSTKLMEGIGKREES